MSETRETGNVKKGCAIFLGAILILGVAAGISVLVFGKTLKPKARAVVLSKPLARIEQVKSKIAPDAPAEVRDRFMAVFSRYSDATVKYGASRFEELSPIGDALLEIEKDGVITADEAVAWIDKTSAALDALDKN